MIYELNQAINVMVNRIKTILSGNSPTIYLYGSCVLDDFKLGWSDIDILVLTPEPITNEQAKMLVELRQALLESDPCNRYYRSFEGGILSLDAFKNNTPDQVVYWGTSGQKIQSHYSFNSICRKELLDNGVLLYGKEIREELTYPTQKQIRQDIQLHYNTIRKYAVKTTKSLYSYGWMLDISRCIYTLQTGEIIAKTAAAQWALAQNLCPNEAALRKALEVRKNPELFEKDTAIKDHAERLGSVVQQYADVLERELSAH